MTCPVLLLTRKDIAALMQPADYLIAVEEAFRASKTNRANSPLPMHIDADGGAFHAKGAAYVDDKQFVALKLNGNFPANPKKFDLPTIQGAIMLANGHNGSLLSVMDSAEITLMRTAAASALAASYLARQNSKTLLVCGCGEQGRVQAHALSQVMQFKQIFAFDHDIKAAQSFANEESASLGIRVAVAASLQDVSRKSDVIVTCTTSQEPIIRKDDVSGGVFIAAVGADNPDKNEIDPKLMAAAHVVADVKSQCEEMGDLRAAIAAGVMSPDDVFADLGDIVVGVAPARSNDREIFIFDSTGTALQDVTSAVMAYRRALKAGVGQKIELGAK